MRVFVRARTGEVAVETAHAPRWRWHVLGTARRRASVGDDAQCWYDEESRFTVGDGWAEFELTPVVGAPQVSPPRGWRAGLARVRRAR